MMKDHGILLLLDRTTVRIFSRDLVIYWLLIRHSSFPHFLGDRCRSKPHLFLGPKIHHRFNFHDEGSGCG